MLQMKKMMWAAGAAAACYVLESMTLGLANILKAMRLRVAAARGELDWMPTVKLMRGFRLVLTRCLGTGTISSSSRHHG